MSLGLLSLLGLAAAVALSTVSRVNIGLIAIVLAWAIGVRAAGMSSAEVLGGFPIALFVTLVGVTLLFAQAHANGTLERLTRPAVRLCRGHAGVIPIMCFVLTALISAVGAGNIAAVALMAPMAMAAAGRAAIPPFLMAIMVANGGSAGSVSPFAPTGVVVNTATARMGLPDAAPAIFLNTLAAHLVVALAGYLALGGWRLFARRPASQPAARTSASLYQPALRFERQHVLTTSAIVLLVASVVVFGANVGLAAIVASPVLSATRAADDGAAMRQVPWDVILMVCGVTTLVALLEQTGGLDLLADVIARVATPATATGVTALITGVVSIYSSTTGVVLPAFLPLVPGLVERMGGGDALALVSAITVGGHLVDLSPLSTLGALCMAAAPAGTDLRRLFNQLLAWGLSMSVVGALVSWIVF